jgi:hypothetical protein
MFTCHDFIRVWEFGFDWTRSLPSDRDRRGLRIFVRLEDI